jgi:hypothetical protein
MESPPHYHRGSRSVAFTFDISEPKLLFAMGLICMVLASALLAGIPVLLL